MSLIQLIFLLLYQRLQELIQFLFRKEDLKSNIFYRKNKNYSFEEVDYLISLYHVALNNNDNILSILRYLNEEDSKLTLKRTKSF